jgi:hypothetical protein
MIVDRSAINVINPNEQTKRYENRQDGKTWQYSLVGGFNPSEKYVFVNGKDEIPYMKWKIRFMFENTNQQ